MNADPQGQSNSPLTPEEPADVLMNICAFCSPPHPIYPHEIAGEIINATFIDYATRRKPSQVSFVLCKEHRDILIESMTADLEEAVMRRASIEDDPALNIEPEPDCPHSPMASRSCGGIPYPRTYQTTCRDCGGTYQVTVSLEEQPDGEYARVWKRDHICAKIKGDE